MCQENNKCDCHLRGCRKEVDAIEDKSTLTNTISCPRPLDFTKPLRLRLGREVRIYSTDGAGYYPIHGAYRIDDGWYPSKWTKEGFCTDPITPSPYDLQQVPERFQRTFWVNFYDDGRQFIHSTQYDADSNAFSNRIGRRAFKFTIDEEL